MESVQVSSPEGIIQCPKCKKKFHKDNYAGHLRYEEEEQMETKSLNEREVVSDDLRGNLIKKSFSFYNGAEKTQLNNI